MNKIEMLKQRYQSATARIKHRAGRERLRTRALEAYRTWALAPQGEKRDRLYDNWRNAILDLQHYEEVLGG